MTNKQITLKIPKLKSQMIDLLKTDVPAWNKWRKESPDAVIDLSGVNLRGTNLSEVDFIGANLNGADLAWSNLYGAALTGADLTDANLFWNNR